MYETPRHKKTPSPHFYNKSAPIQKVRFENISYDFVPEKFLKRKFFHSNSSYCYGRVYDMMQELKLYLEEDNLTKAQNMYIKILKELNHQQNLKGYLSSDKNRQRELGELQTALNPGGTIEGLLHQRFLQNFGQIEIQSPSVSGAALKRARYVPGSMQIFIRHGFGPCNEFDEMASDEIEVIFQLEVDADTSINTRNPLDFYGIRFEYFEQKSTESVFKVLNSVFTCRPDSPSFAYFQRGPQGLGTGEYGMGPVSPFSVSGVNACIGGGRPLSIMPVINGITTELTLNPQITGSLRPQTGKKTITMGMRDIPGIACRKNSTSYTETIIRDLNFRIAVQDNYGNFSEVFLKQYYDVNQGNVNWAVSHFDIGSVQNAVVTIKNVDRSGEVILERGDLESLDLNGKQAELNALAGAQDVNLNTFFRIKPDLTIDAMLGPALGELKTVWRNLLFPNLSWYLHMLGAPQFCIYKNKLAGRMESEIGKEQSKWGAGGITFHVFDELKFYAIPGTGVHLVGAFLGGTLSYVYAALLDSVAHVDSPELFKQQITPNYTLCNLFIHTQYEEIPAVWLREAKFIPF